MKMTVITGSPRKNGNTFAMTKAFVTEMEKEGWDVIRFDAAFMNFNGCHACDTCFTNGKACSFDDDFNIIAPHIEDSDAIVFSMPVYWYTMPSQIKGVIDKLYSFYTAGKDLSGKKCGLISCCEEESTSTLGGVLMPYLNTLKLMKWESIGEVLIPGVVAPGDIEKTDGIIQAIKLADEFNETI